MRKKQRSSGKFRLRKRLLYYERPAEAVTSSFSVFSLFQFKIDFCKKFYEKIFHF